MIGKKQACYLERYTSTANTSGGWTQTWATIREFLAYVSTSPRKKTAGQMDYRYDKKTEIDNVCIYADYFYDSAMSIKDRLRINNQIFEINFIENVDLANRTLIFYCQKRT